MKTQKKKKKFFNLWSWRYNLQNLQSLARRNSIWGCEGSKIILNYFWGKIAAHTIQNGNVLYETYKIFIYAKWGWYFRNVCIKFVAENIFTMDIKFIYIYDDKMQISWAPSHMISSWSSPHIDLGSANINFPDWIAFLRACKTKVRTINGFMLITIWNVWQKFYG